MAPNADFKVPASFVWGSLAIRNGCVGLFDDNDFSAAVWTTAPQVVTTKPEIVLELDSDEFRIGDFVRAAGGGISESTAAAITNSPIPTSCGDRFVLIQSLSYRAR